MTCVLVVDDNVALAYFTVRTLQKNMEAVEVVTASSCQEAQTKARMLCPSVVIADMKLPDGDGRDLVSEFARQYPGIKAIVTTGAELPKAVSEESFRFLKKPYGQEVLLDLVRQALGLTGSTLADGSHPRQAHHRPTRPAAYDRHYVRNRFSALLAGIRALQADLSADANNVSAVRNMAEVDVERLFEIAVELSDIIKQADCNRRDDDG